MEIFKEKIGSIVVADEATEQNLKTNHLCPDKMTQIPKLGRQDRLQEMRLD